MRVTIRLIPSPALCLALALVPGVAAAKAKTKPAAAPVESAAARAARFALAEDVGERKDSKLRAPVMTSTEVTTGDAASPERGPSDATPAQPVRSSGPLSGAMEELVARQLQRNHAAAAQIDKCLADERARDARAAREVEVTIVVADKNATFQPGAAIAQGALGTCLATVSGLKLSLPDQAFTWHFALGSSGAAGSGDHREMATP